ncbi:MAG: hypothetical protein ACR2GW_04330 [Pyrinomonadaceae bacterium]|nr:hypothetical protein [Acidobacteriota bacterium]
MTKQPQERKEGRAGQPGRVDTKEVGRKSRPLTGWLIAGGSLAALFGLAYLKGWVRN